MMILKIWLDILPACVDWWFGGVPVVIFHLTKSTSFQSKPANASLTRTSAMVKPGEVCPVHQPMVGSTTVPKRHMSALWQVEGLEDSLNFPLQKRQRSGT